MVKNMIRIFFIILGWSAIIKGCFLWSQVLGLIVSGLFMLFFAFVLGESWKKYPKNNNRSFS